MQKLYAYHDSTSLRFRSPFGALPTGGEAALRLYLWGGAADRADVTLRVWGGGEQYIKGEDRWDFGTRIFTFRVTAPEKPCMLWYNFRVELDGRLYYVGAEDAVLRSGKSKLTRDIPHDYRITVYDRDFTTPEAFCGSIAYQIFPDRFCRGEYPGFEEGAAYHRSMGRRITEKRWDEEVDYLPRDGEEYYSPADFYMGNLQGIADKIPYLKSLGVKTLYLNPIFESPYNHRYSICDYMKIDPLLGTEEDFSRLAAELKANGIRLILDGVFSHTGDDSRYFDRYGRYGGGAYLDERSPYREWYDFSPRYRHGFRCWWDFESLPEVEELTPTYMDFVAEVLEKWVKLGASGWRLDVADELPDDFIKFLRKKLKAIDPDAILIGEVWEDAALKRDCFGKRREYVNGLELDGVMDYPFMEAVTDFLVGRGGAADILAALCAQLEGYPKPFMRAQLGLIGSHDMPRVMSILSGAPKKPTSPRAKQAVWSPDPGQAALGKLRMKQASALQFMMPFMPCVYYGDEAGMTGLADPFSRRPYPWGREDADLMRHYRSIAAARSGSEVFVHGATAFAAPTEDVFAVSRTGGGEALCIVNRASKAADISLSPEDFTEGEAAPALLGEYEDTEGAVFTANGTLRMTVPANGFAFLVLKDRRVLH